MSLTPQESRELLSAFADGELDVRENAEVLEALASDPDSFRRVTHQQALRDAVKRCLCEGEHEREAGCPDELRAKIEGLIAEGNRPDVQAPTPRRDADPAPVVYRFPRWGWVVAAAVVLLAAGLPVLYQRINQVERAGHVALHASPFSMEVANNFAKRHITCSKDRTALEAYGPLVTQIDAMPDFVQRVTGKSASQMRLDLVDAGFRFDYAGNCRLPTPPSVHMVYRSTTPGDAGKALSIWIVSEDVTPLKDDPEGQVRMMTAGDAQHPAMCWRQGGLVCIVVGDSLDATIRAGGAIRQAAMQQSASAELLRFAAR